MTERPLLYDWLPADIRTRDALAGQPLRALMSVLQTELDALRVDTETMWDDWFIETCEAWLVPYIGELLGVRGMRTGPDGTVPLRAFVARQIAYRRRKGTVAALEELARDLIGRPAVAVEYFRGCITDVHTQHVRTTPAATVGLRDTVALRRVGSPFESFARTTDVRSIALDRGRHAPSNVGLFTWAAEVMRIEDGRARVDPTLPEAFHFDPLGRPLALFGAPQTETAIESLAQRRHVPRRLTRVDLFREERDGITFDRGAFAVVPDTSPPAPATAWRIEIADLGGAGGGFPVDRPDPDVIRVDPERGRILFATASAPAADAVRVDYAYGQTARVGAGPFDRTAHWRERFEDIQRDGPPWFRRVCSTPLPASAAAVTTFTAAVADWNAHLATLTAAQRAQAVGVIALCDSRTYATGGATLSLPAGARLFVAALAPGLDPGPSLAGDAPSGIRPVLDGDLSVQAEAAPGPTPLGGGLTLDGVLLAGMLRVLPGELERLVLAHCTLPLGHGGIEVQSGSLGGNVGLALEALRCELGPITAPSVAAPWHATDCVIHGDPMALTCPAVTLNLEGTTVIGGTIARIIEASNTMFAGDVQAEQHQQGCLRYCYAPLGSTTPRRHRCEPDGSLDGVTDVAARAAIAARVRPRFESLSPTDPAYAHLAQQAAAALRSGSDERCEIGVGHHLRFALRDANLRTALRQYLRFGLEAGRFLER